VVNGQNRYEVSVVYRSFGDTLTLKREANREGGQAKDPLVESNAHAEACILVLERLGVPSVTGAEGLGLAGLDGLVHGLVHPVVDDPDEHE
jgi:hypothetical protein